LASRIFKNHPHQQVVLSIVIISDLSSHFFILTAFRIDACTIFSSKSLRFSARAAAALKKNSARNAASAYRLRTIGLAGAKPSRFHPAGGLKSRVNHQMRDRDARFNRFHGAFLSPNEMFLSVC